VRRLAATLAALLVLAAAAPAAGAQTPVVRAVLFFSPTCGHCEYVIDELLFPVWFPQYGGEPEVRYDESLGDQVAFSLGSNGTLEILFVDVTVVAGGELHRAAAEALMIPEERRGVPRLVVGSRYLVGSREIPDSFPNIIEEGLVSGGIDWPDLPGLQEALASIPAQPTVTTTTTIGTTTTAPGTTTTPAPSTTTTLAGSGATTTVPATATTPATSTTTVSGGGGLPGGGDSPWDRFRRDATANSMAVAVLALMLLSLAGAAVLARRGGEAGPPGIAVPILALAGLGVAVYLAGIEGSGSEAVCGPVGDCNAVQQSEWARVFGVVPVGLVGVAGYAVVLASWWAARFGSARISDWARLALLAGTMAGTGFSIYLTFLEPFVIGATCMWCLSSAVVVTVLMWLSVRPAAAAWRRLRAGV
jgi:uncharacterized membrane protein